MSYKTVFCAAALALVAPLSALHASSFSQIVVFGDSLSDNGNDANVTNSDFDVSYPSTMFNYDDGRFTNSSDTTPSSINFSGVWHEQLALRFLGMKRASNSLNGGTDYAYGGATTDAGTQKITVENNPIPFAGGSLSITIENMGGQVDDYLTNGVTNGQADPNALYIVWGGGNDLFNDDSATNVTTAANNIGGLVTRLAQAGARTFLVPNVPPLGDVPHYNSGDATTAANLNAASASFRTQLASVLASTSSTLSAQGITVNIIQLDIYSLFQNLINVPAAYGFTDVTDSAQGNSVNCDDYLFWDDIHPTTAGHSQIAQAAADLISGGYPSFFNSQAQLNGDFFYLAFSDGQPFGYYSYQFFPYLYHTDLGFEYFLAANDSQNGAYLYDFGLNSFLYTSPTLYPYLYDFNASAFYYFFSGQGNPAGRVFYNFGTGQYVTSAN